MMRVLILGAGGHGQVVADILLQMQAHGHDVTAIGYLDDNPTLKSRRFLNLPVLGSTADLTEVAHEAAVVAIGDNQTRCRLFAALQNKGERLFTAVHPHVVLATDVMIGPGCVICAGAIVNPGSKIGANVILNTACSVDHHNVIGDHAHIAPGVRLGGEVVVGEGTLIGIGAIVMPRRSIGDWSVIGAGAVVHQDLPGGIVARGVPAKIVNR